MSEKERFIEEALKKEQPFSRLCKQFGISRQAGYQCLKRYDREGLAGLSERSHARHHQADQTSAAMEALILQVRGSQPRWGGDKIKAYLQREGHPHVPCSKTIGRVLKRHGCISVEASQAHKAWIRFEHEHPNDLWQMDFKGHVGLLNGERCHPLTLLDDHSRYSLAIHACHHERHDPVQQHLITVFRTYGLPVRMTMDNGAPWGLSGEHRHTRLSAWLMRLGITVWHSRPRHPQTQGKLERFHRTLKEELLSLYTFADLATAQDGFDYWRRSYNEERPHGAIGLEVPSSRYRVSTRTYPEQLAPIEYDEGMEVRKVQGKGEIHYAGQCHLIGKAFHGHPVGLKANEEKDGQMDVYFCHQRVAKLDLRHNE